MFGIEPKILFYIFIGFFIFFTLAITIKISFKRTSNTAKNNSTSIQNNGDGDINL